MAFLVNVCVYRLFDGRVTGTTRFQFLFRLPLPAEISVVEHLLAVGVDHPVVTFSGVVFAPRHFLEAVVKREIVADGILPATFAFLVEGEILSHVLVDPGQSESPLL